MPAVVPQLRRKLLVKKAKVAPVGVAAQGVPEDVCKRGAAIAIKLRRQQRHQHLMAQHRRLVPPSHIQGLVRVGAGLRVLETRQRRPLCEMLVLAVAPVILLSVALVTPL